MIPYAVIRTLKTSGYDSMITKLERQIATSATESYRYAEWVLGNERFKLGEPAISRDCQMSYFYFFNISQYAEETTEYLKQIKANAFNYQPEH